MNKKPFLTIDEMYDLLYSPGDWPPTIHASTSAGSTPLRAWCRPGRERLTAQAIACSCCGGSHALADCPEDREERELLDSVDYFGFIKPLRFE